ncbi:hypothetical protein O3M35_010870 [Rhynocoris fuscipes]|uniref:Tetraspanin n=1 Tax=Rhynocoris fuscipes TaxID=488301 RepID=A0AAW1D1Y2_9HEMI
MGFCECTSKFALFLFNLICALLGIVIIAFSVITNVHGKPFKDMLDGQLSTVSISLIVIGVLVFLIAFLGCCGAIKESNCMLNTYAVILCVLLIVQVALGITAFVYKNNLESEMDKLVVQAFEDPKMTDFVDEIQIDLHCCGVSGPDQLVLRASCCGKTSGTCSLITAYQQGCKDKIHDEVMSALKTLGIVAIVIAIVELLCVIFAFCLATTYKRWR